MIRTTTTSAMLSSPSNCLLFHMSWYLIGGFVSLPPLVKLRELDGSVSTSITPPSTVKQEGLSNALAYGREQQGAKTAFNVKKRIWKRRERQVLYGVKKEYPEWWGEQKRQAGRGGGRGGRGRGGMTMRANAVQAAVEHLKPVLKPNWRIRSKVLAGLVRSLIWNGYDETQGNYICTRYLEL
ncbi:hypothetical protein IGI04_020198 [Brassica rapa subsp. trilocularis]|uniref:AP2/ERF domain-containing protein n=1 Tax=Brassica rapa subsp. trilocularis TaxID=1813537 RepID=A0ABQ7MLG1_BRACM|nr:hypothetical protein IGI04_020198 [Brassica rapa subsp. trilocularis]